MKTQEARQLGAQISGLVNAGNNVEAYNLLAPVLAERTPFRLLDLIGEGIGKDPQEGSYAFLDHIAKHKTMGGWVVIASVLREGLPRDLPGALERCRKYIIMAEVWYATDILAERVPGPAMLLDFDLTLDKLTPWRTDPVRWVRRAVGVAVHLWAKRSRGEPELAPQAKALLKFLEPVFEEREIEAVKGVGWGLKTLGRNYPELVTDWLILQVDRPHRVLMLRKATTYLSNEQRSLITGKSP